MEYYLLTISKKSKNLIKPYKPDGSKFLNGYKKDNFDSLDELMVVHFDNDERLEIVDLLLEPTLMISDEIKSVIENYNKEIKFKGVQFFSKHKEDIVSKLFWIPNIKEIDSLHHTSEVLPNKSIKKLVIDKDKIKGNHIFKVADILENRIIVSLRVAEAILRRKPLGISLEKVEMI